MYIFSRLTVVCAAVAVVASLPVAVAAAQAPIHVKSCSVGKPKPFSRMAGGTQITYTNLGSRTAESVTFAVGYRNAEHNYLRRTTDVGSFAPHATINHTLPLYNDVVYAGAKTSVCMPVRVQWAGGTVWMVPAHH